MAAKTDPLKMTTMSPEEARSLIIRSVTVQDADMDEVFQLPATTWIGGKVRHKFCTISCNFLHLLNIICYHFIHKSITFCMHLNNM